METSLQHTSAHKGRVLSCGMDDTQEQDHYEERLREVFNSFDADGCGSLSSEELSDLCQSLQLGDATPAVFQTLLQNQDPLTARVDFDRFKNALILVFTSAIETSEAEEQKAISPASPEIQPKFVKGSKRYGRRSTPEFTEPIPDLSEAASSGPLVDEDLEDNDSAVPRKRERWNAHETSTEEYEAEGQLHLWNPDEPSTPRGSIVPPSTHLEEKLREACEELGISWEGSVGHPELLTLCEHLQLEVNGDLLLSLNGDGAMNVQEFVSRVVSHNKPPTPSASTPYRQLKRHHSTQPFDEGGRRITTPAALSGTIGMRLFSTLDDGTGFTPAECILDAWIEEGIENSTEILQALSFSLDGKVSLSDLTMALENELLVTKNGIHQAALASFKAEIRYLLERVDKELREKEKIRTDLEKAEKLKTQLATEVDEHHSAIEQMNSLNIRKLEQDHKEKLAAVRSELMKEINHIQQQAGLQREELEAEMEKIREDESFLRDHLSISVKENRRLEMELLDSTEQLVEAESQITKLQISLDNIMKEKFGDLDPGSADFFHQEERIKQLRSSYEAQCRDLQDRIDELQSELQEFHSLGRGNQSCNKPLSEELESKSPGMESDPGIGSEDVQPFSLSLEAEMMLEQLKEQHLQEIEDLRNQLESKINEFDKMIEKQRSTHEDQKAALILHYQQEVQALREEMATVQSRAQQLESQIEQAELDQKQAEQRDGLQNPQDEEGATLRRLLQEAQTHSADLEEQLKALEAQQATVNENLLTEMEELKKQHANNIKRLEEKHLEIFEARLDGEKSKHHEEKRELEKRFLEGFKTEKELLLKHHQETLLVELEEAKVRLEEEHSKTIKTLTEQWEKERARMDEQSQESLQALLEDEMLQLVREHDDRERKLKEHWETERAELQQLHEEALLSRKVEERLQVQQQWEQRERKLREEWEREKLQLEEDYEGMIQDRLNEEREKLESEREEVEKRIESVRTEERERLEERHREVTKELAAKHSEERDALSAMLEKLRDDITQERRELETSFTQRIKEVEDRFSGDQESVVERFQSDILKLEQHYRREVKALSEKHVEQKHQWEAQIRMALENGEEQRRKVERERESQKEEWTKERDQLEKIHEGKVEELILKNKQLRNELDDFTSAAQNKEIELSRQLNDLYSRLQESLETKDELVAQAEDKVLQTELLLSQAVEDFQQEKEELEAKYNEMLRISERQVMERIELLTERDDLKIKIEELEMLLERATLEPELENHGFTSNSQREELMTERDPLRSDGPQMKMTEHNPALDPASNPEAAGDKNESVPSFLGATEGVVTREKSTTLESCEETNPQDVTVHSASPSDERRHEAAADPAGPEEAADLGQLPLADAEVPSSPENSHDNEAERVSESDCEHLMPQDCLEHLEADDDCPLFKLQALYNTATEENLLLHEKIALLQQKSEILEDLLAHNGEKIKTSHQVLEENYTLKVKMLLLMEHVRELETKALKMAELHIRYEDCLCENAKLRDQNDELERRVWSLESAMNIFPDFHDLRVSCVDEISLRDRNAKLLELICELEGRDDVSPGNEPGEDEVLDASGRPAPPAQLEADLDDCCVEFEKRNGRLRRAIAELQDRSQAINETTEAHRAEVGRLAEENLVLRERIAALEEEDFKEGQLMQTLEVLQKEKLAAQKAAEHFKQQISELRLQNQQLERESGVSVEHPEEVEDVGPQLVEPVKGHKRRAALPGEDENQLAACVSSLEAELTKALKDTAQLEGRNIQLSQQLSDLREKEAQLSHLVEERRKTDKETQGLRNQLARAQEKIKAADETLQAVTHQSSRLKADVCVLEQEKDSLKHELAVLHKQLQNADDKNRLLEMALHSSGLQSQSKRLYRDEMSRLMEQEQQLLRQENERLQSEVHSIKGDLLQSREKVHQLDATILSLKQHRHRSQSSLVKALEQENAFLKQELEAQKDLNKGDEAGQRHLELENLQQENEALKAQMARLSMQLLETFPAQLVGLLPPSPHRMPRGPHRAEDPDNVQQDDRERKMKNMEERMREIELSLRNVKLLLKEKVAQLKDQLHKNGKADVLIGDLYVENAQLLKALERTQQRHTIAEKKNYLLEEKISSLNKIVRDLNPSPLSALSYHFKRP
ncbi:ninein isoform X3 [Betta splendens]|uniref:Ninein isoform X3 n=1 Tax=Betta splendens TaxID=158456 RepID=A0A9W2XIA9_BETSP|nr:ninein isoform X3 [Betta splendens]